MQKVNIKYSHHGEVCRVILNDGRGNILDKVMMLDLLEVLDKTGNDRKVKLITFEGHGKHFSFGASIAEHTNEQAHKMLTTFHKIFYKIVELGIPTLAKISGHCLGGGLELALICNVLFADKTAKIGQPEIILGVFPPPASLILPLKIGCGKAEELLITGRSLTADEAKALDIVNQVFDTKEKMEEQTEKWIIQHIIPKSASSLRFATKAARKTFNQTLKKRLPELEKEYLDDLMETNDANEGILSFLEKRDPMWENS